ncbi:ICK [Lepeophtheirus salmonis]|uniref:ICK n=1 Tax=Lepeophtheirus salmonis TaxID=72036 RepID=A0A7R8CVG4_LEPSM|nr:ICK [Lepeophtheirus salmonis]CAF2943250.1 ICK [Lepeophtheirus salmonis]
MLDSHARADFVLNFNKYCDLISKLGQEFEDRFNDFDKLDPCVAFIANPFMELMSQQHSLHFWSLVDPENYKGIHQARLKISALFGLVYLCEAAFSDMNVIKSKFRTRLTNEHFNECIRVNLRAYTPAYISMVDSIHSELSKLLNFSNIKMMTFELIKRPHKATSYGKMPEKVDKQLTGLRRYRIVGLIGDGTYGYVYLALNVETQEKEVKTLKKLHHPNVIKLREVIRENNRLYFIFDYIKGDLLGVMRQKDGFFEEDWIMNVIYQILQVQNNVKIADFGLAREIRSNQAFTDYVSTRWYRAPEVLLRSTNYNSPIDLWALGCITRTSEIDQLYKVCNVLGSPNKEDWLDGFTLATKINFRFPTVQNPIPLSQIAGSNCSSMAISFLQTLLEWNPSWRSSAPDALKHSFFQGVDLKKSDSIKHKSLQNIGPLSEVQGVQLLRPTNHHSLPFDKEPILMQNGSINESTTKHRIKEPILRSSGDLLSAFTIKNIYRNNDEESKQKKVLHKESSVRFNENENEEIILPRKFTIHQPIKSNTTPSVEKSSLLLEGGRILSAGLYHSKHDRHRRLKAIDSPFKKRIEERDFKNTSVIGTKTESYSSSILDPNSTSKTRGVKKQIRTNWAEKYLNINCQYHYTDNFVDHENSSMDKFSADIAPLNIRGPNSTCDVAYLLQIPVCFTRELIQPPSMSYIPPKNCRYFENNEKIMICENEISNPFTWTHSELHFLQLENHFTLKKLPNISNIHTRYLRIYAETLELINGGENSDRIIGLEIYGGKFSHGTEELDLSDSIVQTIEEGSFIELKSLKKLHLSNCKNLKDLNGGHVAAMQHLRYLDISHTNLFNGIPNDFSSMNLKCCSRLEFINLTNTFNDFQDNSIDDQMQCAITHISTSMLKDFSKLSFLDMSDNLRLTCGFDVIHFHNLTLHRSGLNVFEYENGSGIFCHFPRNHTIRYVLTIGIRYVYSNRYYISYHWMTSKMNYDENKNNNRSYTYDAFISYSDKDREWVFSELIPHLEEDFNVCVHERDFKVGMMVVDNIVSCIDKSRKFIAVLSPSFVNSKWCAFEIHVAQNQMKKSQEQFLKTYSVFLLIIGFCKCSFEWMDAYNDRKSSKYISSLTNKSCSLSLNEDLVCCGPNVTEKTILSLIPYLDDLCVLKLCKTENLIRVSKNVFNHIATRSMILSDNSAFEKIETGAFSKVENLENITIYNCKLEFVSEENSVWDIFIDTEGLKYLNLSKNRLTNISFSYSKELELLPTLNTLILDSNPIISINNNFFKPILKSKLQTLSLSSCKLIYIESDALKHLTNLETLVLNDNSKLFFHNWLSHSSVSISNITEMRSGLIKTSSLMLRIIVSNMKLCVHTRDFIPGKSIAENIVESLEKSRACIVILSDSYLESKWCRFEYQLAYDLMQRQPFRDLILVKKGLKLRTKSRMIRELKYFLCTHTYLEWREDFNEKK